MVTKDGDVMIIYNVDISNTSVFYTSEKPTDSEIKRIEKSKVYLIKRPDGTNYDLSNTTPSKPQTEPETKAKPIAEQIEQASASKEPTPTPAPTTQPEQTNTTQDIYAITERVLNGNRKQIAEHNSKVPDFYVGKKGKKANRMYCALGISEESIIQNSLIALSFRVKCILSKYDKYPGEKTYNHSIVVTVHNMTDKIMYVDLGNSFFIRGLTHECYYMPTSTSLSTSHSKGASVNLGSIASAAGIGGKVGTLASGVNVGGGTENSSTTVTYSKRIVPIPPHAMVDLAPMLLFTSYVSPVNGIELTKLKSIKTIDDTILVTLFFNKKKPYLVGEIHDFNESNSPLKYGVHITYSQSENFESYGSMSSELYLQRIIGLDGKNWVMGKADGASLIGANGSGYLHFQTFVDKNKYKWQREFPRP